MAETVLYRPSSPVNWSWVVLSGPDAKDFLHRLTTVDVRNLELGRGSKGFFLTAQGKVRTYFTLWHFSPDEYAFELDAGSDGRWKQELLAAIDQYTFGEKIAVSDVTALECVWILGDAAARAVATADETVANDDEIRLCRHSDADFGVPWVSAWGRGPRLAQWAERAFPGARNASFEEIERLRIEAVRPRVGVEVTEAANPLELGLKDGVADNKGCYPGQEVIEKIVALGSPARRLVRVDGEGPAPAPGEKLLNEAEPPAEVGEITSAVPRPGGFAALAIVRKIHAKEGLPVRLASAGAKGEIVRVAPYA